MGRALVANSKKKRLAVARFWYEGNAFSPVPSRFDDVRRREWTQGVEALAAARDTATELAAVEYFARTRPDWDVTVLRCASAMPAGPMEDDVFDTLKREIIQGLAGGRWDAIYLSLHGAAITATRQSPDIELLQAVRASAPGVPVGASFDLHANIGPRHAPLLDVTAGYRTYPHIDMREAAERVLDGLVGMVEQGRRFSVKVFKPGLILPSFNMRTEAGPMKTLQDEAAGLRGGAIADAIVFGGFPYADSYDTGASVVLVTDTGSARYEAASQAAADVLLNTMRRLAPEFQVSLPTPREALDMIVARARTELGLFAITDPADNPLSGGTNDTPALFAAMLQTPSLPPSVFACFTAPDVVEQAHAGGVGSEHDAILGARHSSAFGAPVAARMRVVRLTAGEFVNEGPMEHGVLSRCGRTALLEVCDRPEIQVIVSEAVAPTHDPGLFTLHGIDLGQVRLLCAKAKNHFRAAFGQRCVSIIDVDAPGPAALNLDLLPFKNAAPAREGAAT
ncbi:M81 family metallopeptidase [Paracandidimonas lactea]|uniref:M81 family metallopeptidase n=1 Tax=Paracandidimonas lactea TaxID=2895524 RepID=UPI001F4466F0|nr:M81 family metallopeptidase [Paracandidimonas lactea]